MSGWLTTWELPHAAIDGASGGGCEYQVHRLTGLDLCNFAGDSVGASSLDKIAAHL